MNWHETYSLLLKDTIKVRILAKKSCVVETESSSGRLLSAKFQLLAAKWEKCFKIYITSDPMVRLMSHRALKIRDVKSIWFLKAVWRCYHLDAWYLPPSFICGILVAHFWWLFVSFRHCYTHRRWIREICFYLHIVLRFSCSPIFWDSTKQSKWLFQFLVLNEYCCSCLRRYCWKASGGKCGCNSFKCEPFYQLLTQYDRRELHLS